MTATVQVDPADLNALVAHIAAIGTVDDGPATFKTVSLDPVEVNRFPGVWIRIEGFDITQVMTPGYAWITTTLHIIAGDKPWSKAFAELLPLLDVLVEAVTPDNTQPVRPTAVPLPDQALLPALAVPYTLRTTPEEE